MSKNIAIIGGGYTGLVAARELARKGHRITVFESGPGLGGLAGSFKMEGEPIERAYHHLFRTDSSILDLIDELNLSDLLEWHPSSVAIYRGKRTWSFMSAMDLLRFGACSWFGRIRTGMTALYLKKTKNWKPLAKVSAMEWMRKYCGDSATDAIWEPLLRGKFAADADRVSMAWLWARLHVRANSREPGSGEKLGYIRGGFVKITQALESELRKHGVSIHCNTPIDAISVLDGKPQVSTGGATSSWDAVLFTGSNGSFAKILPEESGLSAYKRKLGDVRYLGATCLAFSTNQNLSRFYWTNINDADSPFLVFIQHTNLIPTDRYNGKHIYYVGAYLAQDSHEFMQSEDELKNSWFLYLKQMFPDFDPNLIHESRLFKFREAQHVANVGYEEVLPSYDSPLPGVFLSNFSQIFPEDRGTNFAVFEGTRIAEIIQKSLQYS